MAALTRADSVLKSVCFRISYSSVATTASPKDFFMSAMIERP